MKPVEHGSRLRRRVALTFDDGPDEGTPAILDVLARHGAPATFFALGRQIGGREEVLRRAVREGHEVGNHSFTHADLDAEPWRATEELERASGAIAVALGRRPTLFRPPLGAWTPAVLREAAAKGMRTVLWDVNPHDYAGGGRTASHIAGEVLASARRGSIVLLHDGGEAEHRGELLRALPDIVAGLGERLELVTVAQLLR